MNKIVAEKKYISEKLGLPYENLSQGYLRAEVLLGNTGQIDFQIQENKVTSKLITERLLALNDQFVVTHFNVSLKHIASATPTDLQQAKAVLYNWENLAVFSGTNNSNVAAIFNSDMSWTLNRKEYIPQFPLRAFRRVPRTQNGTDVGYGSSGNDTQDSFDNGLYGFYPSEPTVVNGRQTIDISINLDQAIDFADAGNSVYAVLEVRGYLLVNAKT